LGGLREETALARLPALQRGLEIGRGVALQAADDASPLAGQQLQLRLADLQMIIAVKETAPAFDRKIKIFDPLPGRHDNPSASAQAEHGITLPDAQYGAIAFDLRVDFSCHSLTVVVTVIDH
jgi:hypothetical protein